MTLFLHVSAAGENKVEEGLFCNFSQFYSMSIQIERRRARSYPSCVFKMLLHRPNVSGRPAGDTGVSAHPCRSMPSTSLRGGRIYDSLVAAVATEPECTFLTQAGAARRNLAAPTGHETSDLYGQWETVQVHPPSAPWIRKFFGINVTVSSLAAVHLAAGAASASAGVTGSLG